MKSLQKIFVALVLFGAFTIVFTLEPKEAPKAKKNVTEEKTTEQSIDPKDRKMVACVTLFYEKKSSDEKEWENLKVENSSISKQRKNKVKAIILEKCSKSITDAAASNV